MLSETQALQSFHQPHLTVERGVGGVPNVLLSGSRLFELVKDATDITAHKPPVCFTTRAPDEKDSRVLSIGHD